MTPEQIAQAKALREQRRSFRAIAEELDMSLSSVYRALQEEEPPAADTQDETGMNPVQQASAKLELTRERLAECQQEQQAIAKERHALLEAEKLDEKALAKLKDKDAELSGRIEYLEARIPILEQRLIDAQWAVTRKRLEAMPQEAERLRGEFVLTALRLAQAEQTLIDVWSDLAEIAHQFNELKYEEVFWVDYFRLPNAQRPKLGELDEPPDLSDLQRKLSNIWHSALSTENSEWYRRRQELAKQPRKPRAAQPKPTPAQPPSKPAPSPSVATQPAETGELFVEQGRVIWEASGVEFTAGQGTAERFDGRGLREHFSWRDLVQLARQRKLPSWASKVPRIQTHIEQEFAKLRAAGEDPHVRVVVSGKDVTRTELDRGSAVTIPLESLRQRLSQAGSLPQAWDFPAVRQALGC